MFYSIGSISSFLKKYLAEKGYSRRQISRLAKTLTINNEKAYLTSTLKTNDELRFNLVGQDEGKRLENIEIKYQNQDLIYRVQKSVSAGL